MISKFVFLSRIFLCSDGILIDWVSNREWRTYESRFSCWRNPASHHSHIRSRCRGASCYERRPPQTGFRSSFQRLCLVLRGHFLIFFHLNQCWFRISSSSTVILEKAWELLIKPVGLVWLLIISCKVVLAVDYLKHREVRKTLLLFCSQANCHSLFSSQKYSSSLFRRMFLSTIPLY